MTYHLLDLLTTFYIGLCYIRRYPVCSICSFSLCFERIVSASTKGKHITLGDDKLREGCRLGIDSHADMSCIGAHATILEVYEGQLCNIMPFNDTYTPLQDINSVNAAFAYDTDKGTTYILNVNQALDFSESMTHSLLCPNQARMNGIVIEDRPRILDNHGRSTHSIYFPEENIRCHYL